jgi:hypothetical protein
LDFQNFFCPSFFSVQKKLHSTKLETEKEMYKKQINIFDYQIGNLVYELYGLSDEEIKIVEEVYK